MSPNNVLLNDREAAALLGASKSTVWRWASEGIIPRPLRIGGISRWKLADLEVVIARAEAQREVITPQSGGHRYPPGRIEE